MVHSVVNEFKIAVELSNDKKNTTKKEVIENFHNLSQNNLFFRNAYEVLIATARKREILTYGEYRKEILYSIAEKMMESYVNLFDGKIDNVFLKKIKKLDDIVPKKGSYMGNAFGSILGLISKYEFYCSRPFLSTLVVRNDSRQPGAGLISLIKSLTGATNFKISCEQERCYIEWGAFVKLNDDINNVFNMFKTAKKGIVIEGMSGTGKSLLIRKLLVRIFINELFDGVCFLNKDELKNILEDKKKFECDEDSIILINNCCFDKKLIFEKIINKYNNKFIMENLTESSKLNIEVF